MKFEATLMATALLASSVSTFLSLQMVLPDPGCVLSYRERFCADIKYERGCFRKKYKTNSTRQDQNRLVFVCHENCANYFRPSRKTQSVHSARSPPASKITSSRQFFGRRCSWACRTPTTKMATLLLLTTPSAFLPSLNSRECTLLSRHRPQTKTFSKQPVN